MQRVGNLILIVFSGLVLWKARDLGLGSFDSPGPGLWPFLIGCVMLVVSVGLLLTERTSAEYESVSRQTGWVALGGVSLGVYIIAFTNFGFVIPTFVCLLFWLRVMAKESWRLTLVLSVGLTGATYALFVTALSVPFPQGPVEQLAFGG